MEPDHSLAAAVSGFRLPFEGARMLLRERRLWLPALVPVLLSLAAVAAAVAGVIAWAAPLHGALTGWLPEARASHWVAWLWIGPARLALWLFGALLFLAAAGLCVLVALLLASLLASPFHDLLAARVEAIVAERLGGEMRPAPAGGLRAALRALREELRRILFYASLVAPLAGLGLLVPPAQVVTAPALLAITLLFLPLDYASYCFDRRGKSFAEKRRWLRANVPALLGFGAAALLVCAIPGANFVAMPLLVVGGTLLALRLPA